MKTKLFSLLILVSMLFSACSQATPTAVPTAVPVEATKAPVAVEPTKAPAATPITLKVYVVDFQKDVTDKWLTDEVVTAFQKTHPNVNVEFIWGSWSTFGETVAGYFAAGDGPDIINLGSEFNGLYGDKLAPLNKYLGEAAWPELKNFIPGTLENASWKGELRGLPIFSAPRYVFCRKDLMEAAGVTAQPTDFAGWVDFAKKLTKIDPATNALTQQGFIPVDAGTMADFQWYLNTLWSIGGKLYKDDGVTPNFDSPEAAAAIKFNYDLKKAVYPDENVAALPAGQGSVIDGTNGGVCLWHSGWAAPAADSAIWSKIDIQPFTGDPTNFPNSKPIVVSFVDWWSVPAYSKNVEMAAEFMKFVFNKDNNNKYNQGMGLIPARVDSQTGFIDASPVLKTEAALAAKYSYGYAGILEPTKLQEILQKELGAYLTDQQDQASTLKNIQDQYAQALKDAGYKAGDVTITVPVAPPVTLKVYVVDFQKDVTDKWLTDEVVPAFQKTHPNVTVEFIWGSWSTFGETVAGYFAAGDGPDIINLGSEFNGLYGDKLAPLNKYLGEAAWPELKNFIPGTLENASWKGELRGLPIFSAPRYVFCRKDLMEAAGVTAQPTDFAGWVDFAKKLTKIDPATNALTQQGFIPVDAGTMADFQWYLNTLWSIGGKLYKEDGVTPNFDSKEAEAAMKFNYDLKKAVYPDENVAALPAGQGSVIDGTNGGVCLWHSGWAAPAADSAIWSKIDIQPFTGDPTNFPNSKPIVVSFVDWWSVPAYSKNVEMAAEFMKFVFNKDNNNKYNQGMGLIPARVDSQTGFIDASPVLKTEAALAAKYSYGYAGILEPTKLQEILQKEIGAYLTDQQDLASTLKNIQDQYTQALKDAGYIK